MLDLRNVELICIDTTPKFKLALSAIEYSVKYVNFGKVSFFTSPDYISKCPTNLYNFNNESISVDMYSINIYNMMGYNYFVTHDLVNYITHDYILIVQWDGFIINPDRWTDEFYEYDSIGARWGFGDINNNGYGGNGGNGGFTLRSKRLLDTMNDNIREFDSNIAMSDSVDKWQEDAQICRINRQILTNKGIVFCDHELADQFSIQQMECYKYYKKYPISHHFGFHGYNKYLPETLKERFVERYSRYEG